MFKRIGSVLSSDSGTMPKPITSGKRNKPGVFALELVGSLFFLSLVAIMAIDQMPIGAAFTGTGSFWLPVFIGVAILASIALLVFSFTYLGEPKILSGQHTKNMGLYFAAVLGVTFFAMTIGTPYFFVALIGFIITFIGGIWGYRV